jgi:hypothetical protein
LRANGVGHYFAKASARGLQRQRIRQVTITAEMTAWSTADVEQNVELIAYLHVKQELLRDGQHASLMYGGMRDAHTVLLKEACKKKRTGGA